MDMVIRNTHTLDIFKNFDVESTSSEGAGSWLSGFWLCNNVTEKSAAWGWDSL